MKIPTKLRNLLEESDFDDLDALPDHAKARIWLEASKFIDLDYEDCSKLFKTDAQVKALFKALGEPEGASLEIRGFELDPATFDIADELFDHVELK